MCNCVRILGSRRTNNNQISSEKTFLSGLCGAPSKLPRCPNNQSFSCCPKSLCSVLKKLSRRNRGQKGFKKFVWNTPATPPANTAATATSEISEIQSQAAQAGTSNGSSIADQTRYKDICKTAIDLIKKDTDDADAQNLKKLFETLNKNDSLNWKDLKSNLEKLYAFINVKAANDFKWYDGIGKLKYLESIKGDDNNYRVIISKKGAAYEKSLMLYSVDPPERNDESFEHINNPDLISTLKKMKNIDFRLNRYINDPNKNPSEKIKEEARDISKEIKAFVEFAKAAPEIFDFGLKKELEGDQSFVADDKTKTKKKTMKDTLETLDRNLTAAEKDQNIESLYKTFEIGMNFKEFKGKVRTAAFSWEIPENHMVLLDQFNKEMDAFCEKAQKLVETTANHIANKRDLFRSHAPAGGAKEKMKMMFLKDIEALKYHHKELEELKKCLKNVDIENAIKNPEANSDNNDENLQNITKALVLMRKIDQIENDFSAINSYEKLNRDVKASISKLPFLSAVHRLTLKNIAVTRAIKEICEPVPVVGPLTYWAGKMLGKAASNLFGEKWMSTMIADWQRPKWHLPNADFNRWGRKVQNPRAGLTPEMAEFMGKKLAQVQKLNDMHMHTYNVEPWTGDEENGKTRSDASIHMCAMWRILNDVYGEEKPELKKLSELEEPINRAVKAKDEIETVFNKSDIEDCSTNFDRAFARLRQNRRVVQQIGINPERYKRKYKDYLELVDEKATAMGASLQKIREGRVNFGEGILSSNILGKLGVAENINLRQYTYLHAVEALFGVDFHGALFVPVIGNWVLKYFELYGDHKIIYDRGSIVTSK